MVKNMRNDTEARKGEKDTVVRKRRERQCSLIGVETQKPQKEEKA